MTLLAYIDESCTTDSRGALFVMAGFVASPDQWSAFSKDWNELLTLNSQHFRRLDEFKMRDLLGSPAAIEQGMFFYRAIERHLHWHMSCTVRIDELSAAHQAERWPDWLDNVDLLRNEYFTGFSQITMGLAKFQRQLGLNEPIELVFDEHSAKHKCVPAWRLMRRFGHSSLRPLFAPNLTFADSHRSAPLQAADLLAYWVRESALKLSPSDPAFRIAFPWDTRSTQMKGLSVHCTPDMLRRNFRNAILACMLLRAGARPDTVGAALGPRLSPAWPTERFEGRDQRLGENSYGA